MEKRNKERRFPMNILIGLLAIAAVVVTGRVTYWDMFHKAI